jgi:hypothetical protein
MSVIRDFAKQIGNVPIPIADDVKASEADAVTSLGPTPTIPIGLRICRTTLKEGCYKIQFIPKGVTIFGPRYYGTLRVENIGSGSMRFSGDLYSFSLIIVKPPFVSGDRIERLRQASLIDPGGAGPTIADSSAIPIYPRKNYYSYLKGTTATTTTLTSGSNPCWFALDFDEFRYNQPATGFSGTFPASPTRSLHCTLNYTATPDQYSGTMFQSATELGSFSMQWVSSSFRRASLAIYRLNGATNPPSAVGTEDFASVFNTVGWDLSFNFAGDIPLPPALVGVQNPNQCWSQANCATLMSSIPGYDPTVLDSLWRAFLIAIPATLGCSRGQMFDTGSGNPNNIAREGAVTNSDDGYPAADSSHFGVAQGGLQKNFPRAFLRSASHEVGHTFNQIHQEFEGGADNSIMTTTPSVADVLFSQGKTFPNDINLGFNATVRRHLVHLPDPAVRPGAMDFFGAAVNAPQADQIFWPEELTLQVTADPASVALGEPMTLTWTMTNGGAASAQVPSRLDIESLTARISSTDPQDDTTFLRPAEQVACVRNPLKELAPGESLTGSAAVLWGRDGFLFERPGRYVVDAIVMWQVGTAWIGARAETEVWVSFPLTDQDNRVASLLMHPDVGRAISSPHGAPSEAALSRLAQAQQAQPKHPAINRLKSLGMEKRLKLS